MTIPALGVLVLVRQENDGAEILQVGSGSVAELAGLHVTDVVKTVDGKAVTTPMALAGAML